MSAELSSSACVKRANSKSTGRPTRAEPDESEFCTTTKGTDPIGSEVVLRILDLDLERQFRRKA